MLHIYTFLLILGHLLTVLGVMLAFVLFSRVRIDNAHPGTTMAWLLGMIFIPYLAVPLYFLIGGRKFRHMARKKARLVLGGHGSLRDLSQFGETSRSMLQVRGAPVASSGNRIQHLPDAVDSYRNLIEQIESARESIWIMTFILTMDEVGKEIVALLAKRAREGVEVRLLLDALGSFWALGRATDPISQAGGRVGSFMPMVSLHRKWSANLRNHRKIAIFDGRLAILGGRNIASEYMGRAETSKQWEDYCVTVEGPAVLCLAEVFIADWKFATDEELHLPEGDYIDEIDQPGDVTIQTVASGPDMADDLFYEQLLIAMFHAKTRVWIVTPYFVPDQILLHTLMVLARCGIDVRLITPEKSDRHFVNYARRYYLRELSHAGGRVFFFRGRMLHSKIFIIDEEITAIGSPNMDMRSLYLNYEIALFLFSKRETAILDAHFLRLEAGSRLYRRHAGKRSGVIVEALENLSGLLAPLL